MNYIRWSCPEDAEISEDLKNRYIEGLKRFLDVYKQFRSGSGISTRIGIKVLLTKNNTNYS